MPETIHTQNYSSPVGQLTLGSYNGKLCLADWRYRKMRKQIDTRIKFFLKTDFEEKEDEVLEEARHQLEEYFRGNQRDFDLPVKFCGSEFQQKVWNELMDIPFGETETYMGLARKLGDEKAIRAVAAANGANAIAIIVPCHRVVGSGGSLTGYAGGLAAKKKMLQLEGAEVPGTQPTLF